MPKNKKMVCGVLILAVLAVASIGWFLSKRPTTPPPPPIITPPITIETDCFKLEAQINNLIEQANYCHEDSDCMAQSPNFLVCPFGCYLLLNKDTDIAQIQKGIEEYSKNCPMCLYECPYFPEQQDIKCANNKCVDVRFEISGQKASITESIAQKISNNDEEGAKQLTMGFLILLKDELGITNTSEIAIDKVTLYNFRITIKYHQKYKNIPVYYSFGSVSVTQSGEIYNVKRNWYSNISAPTTPAISTEAEIKKTARAHYKATFIDFFEKPQLYILPQDKLVWLVKMAEPIHKDALINAITGEVVSEWDNLVTEPSPK